MKYLYRLYLNCDPYYILHPTVWLVFEDKPYSFITITFCCTANHDFTTTLTNFPILNINTHVSTLDFKHTTFSSIGKKGKITNTNYKTKDNQFVHDLCSWKVAIEAENSMLRSVIRKAVEKHPVCAIFVIVSSMLLSVIFIKRMNLQLQAQNSNLVSLNLSPNKNSCSEKLKHDKNSKGKGLSISNATLQEL